MLRAYKLGLAGLTALLLVLLPQIARAEGPAPANIYAVQPGDTLAAIAALYGTTVEALADANGITNPDWIYVDQKLTIPNGTFASPNAAGSNTPGPAAAAPITHTYQVSQTLPLAAPAANPPTAGKWIDVNLKAQAITAYSGTVPLRTVRVSTGKAKTPTVTGQFAIYRKSPFDTMVGADPDGANAYNTPNVPNVMYFYRGFSIHGEFWHDTLGTPVSHGCVNLSIPDSKWFYDWAEMGTIVVTHE